MLDPQTAQNGCGTAGNAAYDAGDFREALRKYRAAYELTDDARILYRVGQTYEHLANYQRAREHLELFLLAEPDTPHADRVIEKIESLKTLEASLQSSIDIATTPARAPSAPGPSCSTRGSGTTVSS